MAEGGGGGPGGPIVIQPGRGGDRGNFWSRNTGILGGLFLGPSQLKPYQEKSWLRKTLGASFSEGLWATKEGRTQLMQLGYDIWRATKLANPLSSEYRRTYGKPAEDAARAARRDQRALDRLRSHAAPPADPVPTRPPTQRNPSTVGGSAVDNLIETVLRLYEWYAQQQAQRAAERDARRQRSQQGGFDPMALADVFGNVLGSVVQQAPSILQTIYNAQAARRGPTGASGVPISLSSVGMGGLDLGGLGGVLNAVATATTPATQDAGVLGGLLGSGLDDLSNTELWKSSGGLLSGNRATPIRTVYGRNPVSGAIGVWQYAGKPVLYSGDLATCRRVNKIARRAAGRVGLRFRRRGRR